MVDERRLLIIYQQVADLQAIDLFLAENVAFAIEGAAIGHIGAGHSSACAWGHVGTGTVGAEAVVEGTRACFHGCGYSLIGRPLGIDFEEIADILADAAVIEGCFFMGSRQKVETTIF